MGVEQFVNVIGITLKRGALDAVVGRQVGLAAANVLEEQRSKAAFETASEADTCSGRTRNRARASW